VAADKERDRDWDKEMKEVDKLLSKLPAADPYLAGAPTVPQAGGSRSPWPPGAAPSRAQERLGTWLRVGLGVLLALGLAAWPYSHQCGLRLIFYMIGVATVVVAACGAPSRPETAAGSRARAVARGYAVGLALTADVFLPRMGYTTPAGIWLCPEPPVPPAR